MFLAVWVVKNYADSSQNVEGEFQAVLIDFKIVS